MKWVLVVFAVFVVFFASIAAWVYNGHTKLGPCVGLNGGKDSTLVYEYSAGNIALGVIGFETIIAPVYIALNALECPVRKVGELTHA